MRTLTSPTARYRGLDDSNFLWPRHVAAAIVERALAAKLAVPDFHLRGEVTERAVRPDIDALFRSGGTQCEEWRHSIAMQCDARLVELLDVGAGAAGELEWIHARRRNQPWRTSILPTRTAKMRITIAVRKYCEEIAPAPSAIVHATRR